MGTNCSMKYLLTGLEPSVFSTLLVKIKINNANNKNNVSLFYIESNQKRHQFMDLRLMNNTVIFKWQLDGEPRKLSIQISKTEEIERILVQRYANMITMWFVLFCNFCNNYRVAHQVNLTVGNVSKVDDKPQEGSFSIFYTAPHQFVEIGKDNGLPGCLSDVIWNEQKIGFWNFYEKKGYCTGCVR